jgi:hypothetical protein
MDMENNKHGRTTSVGLPPTPNKTDCHICDAGVCVNDCNENDCESCVGGSCQVCDGDPNHDPNVVTVIATPNPDVNEPNLPASWTLTGGTGTGKLLRTVDRTVAAKTILTCSYGASSKTTTIYVVKVDIIMSGLADANELSPGKYINAN